MGVEGEDARVDNRCVSCCNVIDGLSPDWFLVLYRMLKDDRVKSIHQRSIFVNDDFDDRLG